MIYKSFPARLRKTPEDGYALQQQLRKAFDLQEKETVGKTASLLNLVRRRFQT
jgi:hypothetical protein